MDYLKKWGTRSNKPFGYNEMIYEFYYSYYGGLNSQCIKINIKNCLNQQKTIAESVNLPDRIDKINWLNQLIILFKENVLKNKYPHSF